MGFLTLTCWNNRTVRVVSTAAKNVHTLFVGGVFVFGHISHCEFVFHHRIWRIWLIGIQIQFSGHKFSRFTLTWIFPVNRLISTNLYQNRCICLTLPIPICACACSFALWQIISLTNQIWTTCRHEYICAPHWVKGCFIICGQVHVWVLKRFDHYVFHYVIICQWVEYLNANIIHIFIFINFCCNILCKHQYDKHFWPCCDDRANTPLCAYSMGSLDSLLWSPRVTLNTSQFCLLQDILKH